MPIILSVPLMGLIMVLGGQARADGNADKGYDVAVGQCSGCHVIGADNRHGGIDSTPSFFLMHDKIGTYRQRLLSLKSRPPHTAYERLDGLTTEDITDVIAYIGTLERP